MPVASIIVTLLAKKMPFGVMPELHRLRMADNWRRDARVPNELGEQLGTVRHDLHVDATLVHPEPAALDCQLETCTVFDRFRLKEKRVVDLRGCALWSREGILFSDGAD
jgi:hypothetical protein